MPPSFPNQNQGLVLRNSSPTPSNLRLRGYHPLRQIFPDHLASLARRRQGPQHHISHRFPHGIQFELFPFRSLLLRESRLVSLPPLTKMFQFRGFPLPEGSATAEPWQEVPLGYPRIKGCMRLPEAYRGLPRPSSASEPSYPPDGVACRAYLKAQYPNCVRVKPLHGDHRELLCSLRPSSKNFRFLDCILILAHSSSIAPWPTSFLRR